MFNQPFFDLIVQRLGGLLLVLDRPAVQRQLLLLILLALSAELAAGWLIRLRSWIFARIVPQASEPPEDVKESAEAGELTGKKRAGRRSHILRWLRAMEHIYSPLLAIGLGQMALYGFQQLGWQFGLIAQGLLFFWLLLIYQVMVTVLFVWLSEVKANFYQQRILLPTFLLLIFFAGSRLLSGIVDLGQLRLFTLSESNITIDLLMHSVTVFYAFLVVSWLLEEFLSRVVLSRLGDDPGLSNTIRTITGYVVISAGLLAALGSLGLDLSSLAIIGAGLSVGIGFGLQDLVGNFVSGILILFEQTIRPGDIVEINGKPATVERLRIRSTTVRTFDNAEVIVPNQTLLTSAVTTYTHTDRRVRVRVEVGISYKNDPQTARDALLRVAGRHGEIMAEPEPICMFTGYGESSLDFALIAWVADMSLMGRVASDLRFMIWKEFEKLDIEIPFPQRDLHIRSGIPWDQILPVRAEIQETPVALPDPGP